MPQIEEEEENIRGIKNIEGKYSGAAVSTP